MDNPNLLLSRIEVARLWSYFHKDWLLQIRLAVRQQLPAEYRVFVESEAVLYHLIIRRAPENHVVAAAEMLSPSNKGIGNRFDQQKHLRKRVEYLDAGINLLEIDPLTEGERTLPDSLASLAGFERVAWSAFHEAGCRRFRGWGWNQPDPLPCLDWRIDPGRIVLIDLAMTLREAAEFNRWDALVS